MKKYIYVRIYWDLINKKSYLNIGTTDNFYAAYYNYNYDSNEFRYATKNGLLLLGAKYAEVNEDAEPLADLLRNRAYDQVLDITHDWFIFEYPLQPTRDYWTGRYVMSGRCWFNNIDPEDERLYGEPYYISIIDKSKMSIITLHDVEDMYPDIAR